MSILKLLIPILLATLLNAAANTFWKLELATNPFTFQNPGNIISLFLSFKIILGIIFYGISMILFFYLLSHYQLSLVIPLTALTYIFNFLAAYMVFHENISWSHLLGTFLIIIGIFIIAGFNQETI